MLKKMMTSLICLLAFSTVVLADDVIGFWKTISDKTGKAESIIAVYQYQGKYYGRIIATFDKNGKVDDSIEAPKDRAPGVVGNPFYSGLDIIWDLKPEGSKYSKGKIMDPEQGKIYNAEMWTNKGNLVVRGEIWLFGENQTWPPATESDFPPGFKKPNLATLVPEIHEVK